MEEMKREIDEPLDQEANTEELQSDLKCDKNGQPNNCFANDEFDYGKNETFSIESNLTSTQRRSGGIFEFVNLSSNADPEINSFGSTVHEGINEDLFKYEHNYLIDDQLPSGIKVEYHKEDSADKFIEEKIYSVNVVESKDMIDHFIHNQGEIWKNDGESWINEDLLKYEHNYLIGDQLPSGIKLEFDHKEDSADKFTEEKIDSVNVKQSKDIIDHFIHNQEEIWKNDESWEESDVKVEIESVNDMSENGMVNSIVKREKRDTSTLDCCRSYISNVRTWEDSILMKSRDPNCTSKVKKIEYNNKHLEHDKNIIQFESIKDHVKAVQNFKCDICDYETHHKPNLARHVDAVHLKLKNFKCDICDYETHHKHNLARHVDAFHLKLKNFKCDKCDYKALNRSILKSHVNAVHLKLKNFKCDMCDYKALNRSLLKSHVNAVHLKLKNLKCVMCDYKARSRSALESHVNAVHLILKNFKCDKCDYKSHWKGNLASHVNSVHLKLKNFTCHLCDYVFYSKSDLSAHVNAIHLKLKNFKCDMCDYKAHKKTNLAEHVNAVHLKLKNFKCGKCDYKAHRKTVLAYHLKVVHMKLKNFNCVKCDYKASTKSALAHHVNAVHLKLKNFKCDKCD